MSDVADPAAKRQKTNAAAHTMDINSAVMKEFETKGLSEIVAAPVDALQGVGPKTKAALEILGVNTVSDLGNYKYDFRSLRLFLC